MGHKLKFLTLFLFAIANVECRMIYDEYDEYPAESKSGGNPSIGLLNTNRDDIKFHKLINQRLADVGELRRFQKATNSLRRHNVANEESAEKRSKQDECPESHTHENLHNVRRNGQTSPHVLDYINKKIQELVRIIVLEKMKGGMDGIQTDNAQNIPVNGEREFFSSEREEVDDDEDGDLDDY